MKDSRKLRTSQNTGQSTRAQQLRTASSQSSPFFCPIHSATQALQGVGNHDYDTASFSRLAKRTSR